jgi:hypothetical protein
MRFLIPVLALSILLPATAVRGDDFEERIRLYKAFDAGAKHGEASSKPKLRTETDPKTGATSVFDDQGLLYKYNRDRVIIYNRKMTEAARASQRRERAVKSGASYTESPAGMLIPAENLTQQMEAELKGRTAGKAGARVKMEAKPSDRRGVLLAPAENLTQQMVAELKGRTAGKAGAFVKMEAKPSDDLYILGDEYDAPFMAPATTIGQQVAKIKGKGGGKFPDLSEDHWKNAVFKVVKDAAYSAEKEQLKGSKVLAAPKAAKFGKKAEQRIEKGPDGSLRIYGASGQLKSVVRGGKNHSSASASRMLDGAKKNPETQKAFKRAMKQRMETAQFESEMKQLKGSKFLTKEEAPEIKEGKSHGDLYLVGDEFDAPALSPALSGGGKHGRPGTTIHQTMQTINTEQLRKRYAKQLQLKKGQDSWKEIARVYGNLKAMGEKNAEIAAKVAGLDINEKILLTMTEGERPKDGPEPSPDKPDK